MLFLITVKMQKLSHSLKQLKLLFLITVKMQKWSHSLKKFKTLLF
jgi:hypothetical protein